MLAHTTTLSCSPGACAGCGDASARYREDIATGGGGCVRADAFAPDCGFERSIVGLIGRRAPLLTDGAGAPRAANRGRRVVPSITATPPPRNTTASTLDPPCTAVPCTADTGRLNLSTWIRAPVAAENRQTSLSPIPIPIPMPISTSLPMSPPLPPNSVARGTVLAVLLKAPPVVPVPTGPRHCLV